MLKIEYTTTFIKVEKVDISPDAATEGHNKDIRPFKQQSPDNAPHRDRISPSHLFILFTADIIKQDIIFTR